MLKLPYILAQTDHYAVVYKPPRMHCVPRIGGDGGTLIDWFAANGDANNDLFESGLMHRLDFETNGLVLFAKNGNSYKFFKDLQEKGKFIKEYSAICIPIKNKAEDDGYPSVSPRVPRFPARAVRNLTNNFIESYFRPYGPGRKLVRPVIDDSKKHKEIAKDKGGFFRTEIVEMRQSENRQIFTVRLKRGFRHQIRCHLRWIGFPILNDPLYGLQEANGDAMALQAHTLFFADPASGENVKVAVKNHS